MQDILTFTTPETRWAINMAYCTIELGGIVYHATENAYQSCKFLSTDMVQHAETGALIPIRDFIAKLSPSESKKFAKKHPITNPAFERRKLYIMEQVNWQKYKNQNFRELC